jgi:hypothetical protein
MLMVELWLFLVMEMGVTVEAAHSKGVVVPPLLVHVKMIVVD